MSNNDLIIRPKRNKGDDGYRVFSIRVKENTVKRLDELSVKTEHSRNELIGILLDYALDHCVIQDERK